MALKLYADECVDGRIVAGLRRRNIDIVTANELGLRAAPDEVHGKRANELGRVIVTADREFAQLPSQFGVIFIKPETHAGDAVRSIQRLAMTCSQEEFHYGLRFV